MEEDESAAPHAVVIRPYVPADAVATLAIFLAAVTETAAADYSPEQIQAWARPQERELSTWHRSMNARNSYVATVDGTPAGFSDVDSSGYIDMLFVSPRYQRQGVARELIGYVEAHARRAGIAALSVDASITARASFERFGFIVVAEQHPIKAGVRLTNYRMMKQLDRSVRLTGQLICHTQAQADIVQDLLPLHIALTRSEPGCRSFDVTRTGNPLVWQVEEQFEHAAAFESHQERVGSSDWGRRTAGIQRRYAVTGL